MSTNGSKLMRGSAMRLLANFVNMAVGLFLMPIIITELGDRGYGIWALSGSFLGFYGLMDLGVASAVARFVSRALGSEDEKDLQSFFATSVFLLSGLGIVVLVLAGVLASLSHRLLSDSSDAALFRWLVLILGFGIALRFPTRAFHGMLKSHLRYDLLSGIEILAALLRVPLILLVLRADYGLLGMAFASAGLELAAEACKVLLAFRVHPGLRIAVRQVDFRRTKILLGYGSNVLAASVADILRFRISPLVITVLRTVSMVTPFAIAARLTRILSQMSMALVGVLTPMFSRLEGMNQWDKIRDGYLLACRISTYISVLFGGLMILLARGFIQRWVGPQYVFVVPLLQVMVIGTVFTCAQIPGMSLLYGVSRHKFYTVSNITHGVLTLAMTSILIGPLGLMGVALGAAVPNMLIKFVIQPLYVSRVLRIPVADWYFRHVLRDYAVALGYLVVAGVIFQPLLAPRYLNVFIISTVSTVLFVPYALLVGLTSEQRRVILRSVALGRLVPSR